VAFSGKKALRLLTRLLKASCLALLIFVVILSAVTLWTFEVRLQRWPAFIFSAPFSISLGDNLDQVKFFDRLSRLGYTANTGYVPDRGQWSQTGSALNINFKNCPIRQLGVPVGPVEVSLDWNTVRSIRLLRSHEEVSKILLEPELIAVRPSRGKAPELCRFIPLQKIPGLLVDAILLTEDTNFYSHSGIDIGSIQRAFKTNLQVGRYALGGSTITQQLIRMELLTPEKILWRKAAEIILAVAADAIYSKSTILEAYLNRVYFGHWGPYPVKGVAEAASNFFGKDPSEMDAAECSLLAALIRAPNVINPYRHPERALGRRNMILGLLFKDGKISRDTYDEAVESPVKMRRSGLQPLKADALVELMNKYAPAQTKTASGIQQDFMTSVDSFFQSEAENELKKLGESGAEAHLLLANPESGELRSLVSPGPLKWKGNGGDLDAFLPLLLIPALSDTKKDFLRNISTTPSAPNDGELRASTLRRSLLTQRSQILNKVVASLGNEPLAAFLRISGVRAKANGQIDISPVTPKQFTESYAILASLGKAVEIAPSIWTPDGVSLTKPSEPRNLRLNRTAMFLVNYLLKDLKTTAEKEPIPDKNLSQPSVFTSRDKEGLWGIAYRNDSILVIRLPGKKVPEAKLRKLVTSLFAATATQDSTPDGLQVPEGIVFRRVCVSSGLRATSTCPDVIREAFLKGTEPRGWCLQLHDLGSQRPEGKKK
jgi:hypothetical protein